MNRKQKSACFVLALLIPTLGLNPAGATGSATPKPTISAKPSASPTATRTSRASATPKASPTASIKPGSSVTAKPSVSASPTRSPSSTASPKPKATPKQIILPKITVDPPPRSASVDKAIAYALLQVGKPYVHGGAGPNVFDCSGLTQRAWAAAGITIPRTSGQQFSATIHIEMTDALPGDLIFYGQSGAQHVAMYIGFGLIVEAANPSKGVVISPISTPWHNNNFGGIGRISAPLPPATQP